MSDPLASTTLLRLSGGTFTVPMMAPNGTRFGGWLLNTGDNRIGIASPPSR